MLYVFVIKIFAQTIKKSEGEGTVMCKKPSRLLMALIIAVMGVGILGSCEKAETISATVTKAGTGSVSAARSTGKASQSNMSATQAATNKTAASMGTAASGNVNSELTSEGSDSSSENESNDETESTESNAVSEGKPVDLGGITLKYDIHTATGIPKEDAAANQAKVIYNLIKAAEKKYNFKMESSATTANRQKDIITKSLAGINFADFIVATANDYLPFILNSIVIPLNDYVDFEEPVMKANKTQIIGLWKGKYYGIVYYNTVTMGAVMYNRGLLNREGQPDILTLYKNDNWDWSALLNIGIACTRDTDGDGITDQWGITGRSTAGTLQKIVNSNAVLGVGESNGKFVFNYATQEGYNALQFFADIVYVHKIYTTAGMNQYTKGNVAICFDDSWNHKAILATGLDSITAPPPKGPNMPNYARITGGANYLCVSSLCAAPPAVAASIAKEISITWQEDGTLIPEYAALEFGDESYIFPTAQTREEYFISNMRTDVPVLIDYALNAFGLTTQINAITTSIMSGKSVTTAVEEKRSEIEAVLDNYNN